MTTRAKFEDIDQRSTPSHTLYHIGEEEEQKHSTYLLSERTPSHKHADNVPIEQVMITSSLEPLGSSVSCAGDELTPDPEYAFEPEKSMFGSGSTWYSLGPRFSWLFDRQFRSDVDDEKAR